MAMPKHGGPRAAPRCSICDSDEHLTKTHGRPRRASGRVREIPEIRPVRPSTVARLRLDRLGIARATFLVNDTRPLR